MNNKTNTSLIRRALHRFIQLTAKTCSANRLNILMYHQVLESADPIRIYEPTRDDFYQQMTLIKKYYNPISLSRAVGLLGQSKLPANSICVTFDDGYLNNLMVAAPVLKQLAIPATIFVSTRFSDGENMWNDNIIDLIAEPSRCQFDFSLIDMSICFVDSAQERQQLVAKVIEKIKYINHEQRRALVNQIMLVNGKFKNSAKMMTPAQLRTLSDQGFEIAAHTHDHPILSVLDQDQQLEQVELGKRLLESWLGKEVNGFAYPNGKWQTDYNETTVKVMRQCQFAYAVSTDAGVSTPETNPYMLSRYTPWNNDLLKFHLRLLINTVNKTH